MLQKAKKKKQKHKTKQTILKKKVEYYLLNKEAIENETTNRYKNMKDK